MVFTVCNRFKYSLYASRSLDNFVFKLCYRWTVLLLVTFSFVITCRLLLGDSFSCISEDTRNSVPVSYLNTKCYADGVYTLPAKLIIQKDSVPTIDPSLQEFRRYQSYYPWVNLLFLVQAFNLYLPHLLWKCYESGYIRRMTAGVETFFDKEEKRGLELCYLAKYVLVTQGKHKLYTALYIFFEALNYSISLAQTVWLVHFFNVTGVPSFLPFALETWSDFKNFYFPSQSLCHVTKFSPMGHPMKVLFVCTIPLNALYMKMFLFLHAWYIVLTILCGLVLVYRIALLVPSFRVFTAKRTASLAERSVLKSLCHRMTYSDWFFLTRLQKAMTDVDFAQMLDKIAIISQGKDAHNHEDRRSSLFEDAMKDFDSSGATSPL